MLPQHLLLLPFAFKWIINYSILHQCWNTKLYFQNQLFFLMVSTLYADHESEENAFSSKICNNKCSGMFKVEVIVLRLQMLKLSPQPHVPLMFGLLKTNSLDSLSST